MKQALIGCLLAPVIGILIGCPTDSNVNVTDTVSPVTGFRIATNINAFTAEIAWDAGSDDRDGVRIIWYQSETAEEIGGTSPIGNDDVLASTLNYEINFLQVSTSYVALLMAYRGEITSEPVFVPFTTPEAVSIVRNPGILHLSNRMENGMDIHSATFEWDARDAKNSDRNGVRITWYQADGIDDITDAMPLGTTDVTEPLRIYEIDNLVLSTSYVATFEAYKNDRNMPDDPLLRTIVSDATAVSFTTIPDDRPVQLSEPFPFPTSTTLTVQWHEWDARDGIKIVWYLGISESDIYVATRVGSAQVPDDALVYTIEGLEPDTSYVVTFLPYSTTGGGTSATFIFAPETQRITKVLRTSTLDPGTIDNPHTIHDLAELQSIATGFTSSHADNGGATVALAVGLADSLASHYALANDIDAWPTNNAQTGGDAGDDAIAGNRPSGSDYDMITYPAGFVPIANSTPFTGTLDGRGFGIDGLGIDGFTSVDSTWGLFGRVGTSANSAEIKNLVLHDVNIMVDLQASVAVDVGPIAGILHQSISRVGVTGGRVVVAHSPANSDDIAHVGGLVGSMSSESGVIANSYSRSNVAANLAAGFEIYVGGLVGEAGVGTITNGYHATGTVTTTGSGSDHLIGGLAGNNTPATSMIVASYHGGMLSGGTAGTLGEARSTAQLQCPASQTVPTGGFVCEGAITYVGWNPMIWDFGDATELPALINDAGDTIAGQR